MWKSWGCEMVWLDRHPAVNLGLADAVVLGRSGGKDRSTGTREKQGRVSQASQVVKRTHHHHARHWIACPRKPSGGLMTASVCATRVSAPERSGARGMARHG